MIALYFAGICLTEYRSFQKKRKEDTELAQFADFLSNLNYEFYLCKNVTEAIFRAAETVAGDLRKRLEEICFWLEEEESEAMAAECKYPRHLKYLKLFFVQCQNAVWYGSGKSGEETAFVRTMTELRRDVQNECYKRTQAGFLFAGLGLVAAVPIVFLPFIKCWGCGNMPELERFYNSTAGRLTETVLWFLTFCCYGLLIMLKRMDGTIYRRPECIQRLLEQEFFVKAAKKWEGTAPERYGRNKLRRIGIYRSGTEYFWVCGAAGVLLAGVALWLLRGESFGIRFMGTGFAGGVGIAGGMFFYRYLAYLRTLGMSGEVLGLQSVVLLLYRVPNMTVMKLLSVLEDYAELFQRSLRHCSNAYAAEDEEAFIELRQEETYPAFRQLAGRLAVSERIGLVRAFSDIEKDRQFFREQERLDTEQTLKKRAANGQVLAFVPMMFLLFAELIIPFLAASLSQMSEIFLEMEQIRFF